MTRKYALLVDDEEKVVAVEVNGVRYKDPIQVPDVEDQLRIERLLSAWTARNRAFARNPAADLSRLVPLIFGLVAAICLGVCLFSAISSGRALARERAVPGQVVHLGTSLTTSGTTLYYPIVEFSLPDGREMRVQVSHGSSPASHQPGQSVTVRYDPAHVEQARIQSFDTTLGMLTLPIISGVLGLIFLGAVFYARWILKS